MLTQLFYFVAHAQITDTQNNVGSKGGDSGFQNILKANESFLITGICFPDQVKLKSME